MECLNCGATLKEGAAFCGSCGTPAGQEPVPVVEAPKKEMPAFVKDLLKIENSPYLVGVIAGILFLIAGLVTMGDADTSLSYTSFGGDFYTYTYRGIRAVERVLVDLQKIGGGLLSASGVFLSCFFAGKLLKKKG